MNYINLMDVAKIKKALMCFKDDLDKVYNWQVSIVFFYYYLMKMGERMNFGTKM